MKKNRLLLFPVLLFCFLAGQALAAATLIDAGEIASMRQLIGEEPKKSVTQISQSSSAYEVLFWVTAQTEGISVDDTLSAYMRLLFDEKQLEPELNRQLSDLNASLYRQVLNPLDQCHERLRVSILRLSSLLDLLENENLNGVEEAARVSECRFLQDQITRTIGDAVSLSASMKDDIAAAENAVISLSVQLDTAVRQQLDKRTERSRLLQDQENAAFAKNPSLLSASDGDNPWETAITVIDETQFAFTLVTGPDAQERVKGATVIVTDCKDSSKSQTVTSSEETGVAVLDVKNFTFTDDEASVSVEIKADGYREVYYASQPVKAGTPYVIPMAKDDGSLYLKEATLNGDEMLHDATNGFYYIRGSNQNYSVSFQLVHLPANAEGKLSFKLKDPDSTSKDPLVVLIGEFTADADGRATVRKEDRYAGLLEIAKTGVTVPLSVEVAISDKKTTDLPLAFSVERAPFEQAYEMASGLPSLLPGEIHLDLPKLSPVLDNPGIDVGSPLVPVVSGMVDIDGGFTLSFGISRDKPETTMIDGGTKKLKEMSIKDVYQHYKYATEVAKTCKEDGKIFKWKPMGNGFSWDWNAAVAIGANIDWRNGKDRHYPGKGEIWASASISGTFRYTQQFFLPSPPIPVYLGFDISVTLGVSGDFGATFTAESSGPTAMSSTNYNTQPRIQIGFNIDFGFGVSAGVGVQGLMTIGARGYLLLDNAFTFVIPAGEVEGNIFYQFNLSTGLDVEVKLLLINITVHLLSHQESHPENPEQFIPDKQKQSSASDTDASASSPEADASGEAPEMAKLPEGSQVLSLQGESMLPEGDSSPIVPQRETLFDGRFAATKLVPITLRGGSGRDHTDLVFCAGNDNSTGLGYTTVMYALSDGNNLEIRGAAYATEKSDNALAADADAEYISDFDACYDERNNMIYLLLIHGFAIQTSSGGYAVAGEELCFKAFSLSDDGKSLTQVGNNVYYHPRNENGNTEQVLFAHPTMHPNVQEVGITFVVIGDDLSDQDDQDAPLGHTPGRYVYVGAGSLPGTNHDLQPLWRLDQINMEENEEILQIAYMPGQFAGYFDTEDLQERVMIEGLMDFSVMTGIVNPDAQPKTDAAFTENRIHRIHVEYGGWIQDTDIGYLTNNKYFGQQTRDTKITGLSISNIMPGLADNQLLVVTETSSQSNDDGDQPQTTLTAYNFDPNQPDGYTTVNYGFTTAMGWFGKTHLAGADYLYWLQDYDVDSPQSVDEEIPEGKKPKHLIRTCLYDTVSNVFTPPFDLVKLSYSPRTVGLSPIIVNQSGADTVYAGLYTIGVDTKSKDIPVWQFVDFDYKLTTAMDLESLVSPTGCAVADKDTDLYLKVKNSGNTLVAGFQVKLTGGNDKEHLNTDLGTITVDAAKSLNSSVELYEGNSSGPVQVAFIGGAEAVTRVPSDMADTGERLTLTTVQDGVSTLTEVSSLGLIPSTDSTYQISVHIPSSWRDTKYIEAEIVKVWAPNNQARVYVSQEDTEDVDPGVFSEREIAAAIDSVSPGGLSEANALKNESARRSSGIEWNQDDLALDLTVLRFENGDFVQINLNNRSDGVTSCHTNECEPPTLTFVTTDAEGNETETFRHTFANSIHSGHGYGLLIPIDLVDGDGAYRNLTGRITGSGKDYIEYNYTNNTETLTGNLYRIIVETVGTGEACAQNTAGEKISSAVTGSTIQLSALPGDGCRLVDVQGHNIEISNDLSFTMPGFDAVITVTFSDAIKISGPEDAWVLRGEPTSFKVTYTPEEAELTYAWYIKSVNDWKLIEGESGNTLTIPMTTMQNDGNQYRCILTDRFGQQFTSRTATLHVKEIPVTGDTTPVIPLSLLCFVSAMLILFATRLKKNRTDR